MSRLITHNGDKTMKNIEVYSSHNCPWCGRAKALLESKGLDYNEINISKDHVKSLEMIERSGRRTVPQIFIDDEPIGGFDELSALNQAGKLN
jgi:glutaredoxin 3